MKKEEVYKFLDEAADAVLSLANLSDKYGITICNDRQYIHIYEGIFDICEAAGIKPKREWRNDYEYDVEVYFEYKGVRFMSLYKSVVRDVDINTVELELSEDEKVGVFKEMDKIVKDFDEATNYTHKDSGVLGEV